jgi:hypothetical protein
MGDNLKQMKERKMKDDLKKNKREDNLKQKNGRRLQSQF